MKNILNCAALLKSAIVHISSGPTTVSHLPFPYSVVLYAHTALDIAIGVDHGNILASIGALYVFLYRFRYML